MKYNQLFIANFEAEPHLALLTIAARSHNIPNGNYNLSSRSPRAF